jgi:heme O synthase-like polyprenyltransferase
LGKSSTPCRRHIIEGSCCSSPLVLAECRSTQLVYLTKSTLMNGRRMLKKTVLVLSFLVSFVLIFATQHTLLFTVITAALFSLFFFFPIQYPTRDQVTDVTKKPLDLFSSPFPYICLLIIAALLLRLYSSS